jgi:hypothetical protein
MLDRRVARMRARAAFHRSEAARLEAEADAADAARAAGVSQWGSDLPPLFLQMVLERMVAQHAWGAMRATCSTWCSIVDAWCPALWIRRWTAVMEGKLEWFQSVTTVNLWRCEEKDSSSNLVELRSLPSLRTLGLPASCTERAVDAEAVYGLTTVTTLEFQEMRDMDYEQGVEGAGEWVLDLSRLTTLTSLSFYDCPTVTGEQVEAASRLTGLTELRLFGCYNVSTEGLCTVSRLTALTNLNLSSNPNVTTEVLRAVSGLNALNDLYLSFCNNVTDEALRELRSLTALTTLDLLGCHNVTEAGKQALRTALPSLTIDVL